MNSLTKTFFLSHCRQTIVDKITELKTQGYELTSKKDNTPLTNLDTAISEIVENFIHTKFKEICFYSEEKHKTLFFPALIIDPIDGTREFINNIPEYCVSVGFYFEQSILSQNNWSWIYNPATQEEFLQTKTIRYKKKKNLLGFISKTEYASGFLNNTKGSNIKIQPIGSIAYKLALLAQGKCDFVISSKPKNIWDIAAGVLQCAEAGYKFYEKGKEVTKLDKIKYLPPLLWCHEKDKERITSSLEKS